MAEKMENINTDVEKIQADKVSVKERETCSTEEFSDKNIETCIGNLTIEETGKGVLGEKDVNIRKVEENFCSLLLLRLQQKKLLKRRKRQSLRRRIISVM